MPRAPRQKSESGIYHIMLRGINHQTIFEEDEDYTKFLSTLGRQGDGSVSLYNDVYCLIIQEIDTIQKMFVKNALKSICF